MKKKNNLLPNYVRDLFKQLLLITGIGHRQSCHTTPKEKRCRTSGSCRKNTTSYNVETKINVILYKTSCKTL